MAQVYVRLARVEAHLQTQGPALLEEAHDRLARSNKTDGRPIRSRVQGLKVKLYPYQREGVKRFLQTGRLLLGDDMGLGKTA